MDKLEAAPGGRRRVADRAATKPTPDNWRSFPGERLIELNCHRSERDDCFYFRATASAASRHPCCSLPCRDASYVSSLTCWLGTGVGTQAPSLSGCSALKREAAGLADLVLLYQSQISYAALNW